jgi:hypothetical protein
MALPEPVKAAIIAGLAANKLTGGLVLSGLGDIGKVALGGGGRGGTPLDPVYVKDVGGGLGGGGGGGVSPIAGLPGALPFTGPLATTATGLGLASAIVTPIVAYLDLKYISEGGQVRSRSSMGLGGFKDYDPLSSAISKDSAALDAHAELMSKTTAQLSHDTSGADTHAGVQALEAVQSFFTSKPVVTVAGWNDLLSHRDTSAKDLHDSAQTLDATVRNWRNTSAPIPQVTVNVSISARDVTEKTYHAGWYTPGGYVGTPS